MTGALVGGGKDEMQNALVILMTQLTQLPAAEFATRIKPMTE